MQQSPYLDASQAIDLALKVVRGEKLPSFRNIIPMPVVTAKNAKDVEPDF
jgi:ABC-type sugar transport system substrate-binding protein